MTTIIAVQTTDDVILGWDSQLTNGNEATQLIQPKVLINNGIIYGVAGVFRVADILECSDLPAYDASKYPNPRHWIIKEWTPVFRDELAGEPALFGEKGEALDWRIIMVVGGRAFELDSLLNPTESMEGVYTIGSGASFARGALFAGVSVMDALHIAGRIDPFTGGAYTVATASKYLEAHCG